MDLFLFMTFSVTETVALFALTLSLYRLKFKSFFWPALTLSIIMSLVSFFMRKETDLSGYAPAAILILLVLFLLSVVRMPVIWAIVVALTGTLAFSLIQAAIMLLSLGSLSLQELSSHEWKGYLIQALTGITGYILANVLYKRGIGFSFEFKRLDYRIGTILLIATIVAIAIGFGSVLFVNNIFISTIIFFIGLSFLLYYALKKEKEEDGAIS